MLKDWTKFEKILLFCSITTILIAGFLCNSTSLTILCALIGASCSIEQAKGKIASQFLGLTEAVLYSILSFQNRYYGEVIIYVFIMAPLFISGIISWLHNINKETNTVIKNELGKKEWFLLSIIAIILFVGLYFLLKCFNTEQLLVSTLSMVTSLFATYLVARRSKYGFIFYILNDIILFILWGLPVIGGQITLIPMLFEPLILFINDVYGWINWNKDENK